MKSKESFSALNKSDDIDNNQKNDFINIFEPDFLY